MDRHGILLRRVRLLLAFFMAALALSGLTAIPLQWELGLLGRLFGIPTDTPPESYTGLPYWIATVRHAVDQTNAAYPFLAYGTDWLAFAHLTIAVVFLGPLRDPVRNAWVIDFGLIACVLVIPWALVFGGIRGIPLYWQLIDCSFGLFGLIPLWVARKFTKELATTSS